jgi:hypothetical protein
MIEKPLSIWHVGENFADDERRILFVGKTARGYVGDEESYPFYDTTAWADEAISGTEQYGAGSWPYWSYTKEIIERVHGTPIQESWQRVAFTNLMKCNNGTTRDTTPWEMKLRCLRQLRVFKREVEIIEPRTIVYYTGCDYDAFLGDALFGSDWLDVPGTGQAFAKSCGNKNLPWWEGGIKRKDGTVCRVLRTGHPERKKREAYVRLVVDWLMDLPPVLRQTVKTQNPSNGELSHGNVA